MNSCKIVNDAVFGIIEIKPYIKTIIDTAEFQRLRWVWQLGLCPFVYPTANHTRFEHCVGTYWLASQLITKLQNQLNDEKSLQLSECDLITDKDIICVEIAALCHDIGHGPFSHVWDYKILPYFVKDFKSHENQFEEMWQIILNNNSDVSEILKNYGINQNEQELINRLINGNCRDTDKTILFHIVSNPFSGMDVDKWDYIARDSLYLGHSLNNFKINIDRLIKFARAIKKDNNWYVAFRDKECLTVMNVFQSRYNLHQTTYQHRVVLAMEMMLIDGFKKCIDKNYIDKNCLNDSKWILETTDNIFWSLFQKHNIEEFRRILERRLYKPIFEAVIFEIKTDTENIVKEFLSENNIEMEKIRIGTNIYKLGNKDTNPILCVPFYSKCRLNELFYFSKSNLPSKLDLNINETRLMVFYTDNIKENDNKLIGTIQNTLSVFLESKGWKIKTNLF